MAKQKPRSRVAALERAADKLTAECEQHYQHLRDAFNQLEKARRSLARVNQRIDAAIDAHLNES